jgi:RNA polymerase sigma factor (TIGR02999 family)
MIECDSRRIRRSGNRSARALTTPETQNAPELPAHSPLTIINDKFAKIPPNIPECPPFSAGFGLVRNEPLGHSLSPPAPAIKMKPLHLSLAALMSISQNPPNTLGFDPLEVVHADFYGELRRLARKQMVRLRKNQTLQPTGLVHELWLRLAKQGRKWRDRDHFFATASITMRHILIDHARQKARLRHGGALHQITWDSLLEVAGPDRPGTILLIDEGITELEKVHPELAHVVVDRFFGGMTNQEIAANLGIGERSVERHWAMAKIWLLRWIQQATHSRTRTRTVA